jgi:dTDP-L-rhamnose 4-epimerase
MKILITGGAGFIGGTWIKKYIACNEIEKVYVVDALFPQIHGENPQVPDFINHEKIKFFKQTVQDISRPILVDILRDCDTVIHLASDTGVGQSMYELIRYSENNVSSTAAMLEAIIEAWDSDLGNKRIILSSSRAVYGEGAYECAECGCLIDDPVLTEGNWTENCPACGMAVVPVPTPPKHRTKPSSIYASTKLIQEQMIQQVADSRGFKYFDLRFFNVFGPGQAFGNPYTGILTTFLLRARDGKPLFVYEDGLQTRDFVYIDDVVSGIFAAMSGEVSGTFNIGTGTATSILDIAKQVAAHYSTKGSTVEVTGRHRAGDMRHCTADISLTQKHLDWVPAYQSSEALELYMNWFDSQHVDAEDKSEEAWNEIQSKGMGKIVQ